jgi:hypothetical protein
MTDWHINDRVDLNDSNFGWRGVYRIAKLSEDGSMAYIHNEGTKSRQWVSTKYLRKTRGLQFSVFTPKRR